MSASTSAVLGLGASVGSRARGARSRARRACHASPAPHISRGARLQICLTATAKGDGERPGHDAGDGPATTSDTSEPGSSGDVSTDAGDTSKPQVKVKQVTANPNKSVLASLGDSNQASSAPAPAGFAKLVPSRMRAWFDQIPAKRRAERLEHLLLTAESDKENFVKQDAYMRELAANEAWDEVQVRFESRTVESGPGSVVAYLRALAVTGRLEQLDGRPDTKQMSPSQLSLTAAQVMRDTNMSSEQAVAAVAEAVATAAAEKSALPGLLSDLSQRAVPYKLQQQNETDTSKQQLAIGRSPNLPMHVVVVPANGGYDAFAANQNSRAAKGGGLINFVFYSALLGVLGSAAMGAAQKHASGVTTGAASSGSSTSSTSSGNTSGNTSSVSGLLPSDGKKLPGASAEDKKSSFDPKEYDASQVSESSKKTFDDVKGCDEAKAELQEIVEYLKNPGLFTKLGGKLPKGVLLSGPPGTGKTLLARAVAGEAGVPFFYRAGSEFEEMFVGVGSKRVRQLFKAAKAKMPCIIFIDEIDAVGTSRKAFETQSRKTLNQLLTEMDGFEQNEGIIVIAATNIPEQLDPALTRPGRFDRLVHVPNPDVGGRREILKHYLKDKPLDADVEVEGIARGTAGMSGAELANLVNIAAVQAAVSGETSISLERLEWAKDRIIMGVERKSAVLTEESKKLTAYHEAGHAVVAIRTPGAMPVHKATIVPRGNALGMVTQLPDKDETSITKKQLMARLDVCMGGRVAEELIFGKDEVTTGALSDLQQATRLATYMVGEVGLSSLVGPVHVDSMSKGGRRNTEALVDKEVVQLLRDSHARVTKLLTKHTTDLHVLSAEMLSKETLTGAEIKELLGLAGGVKDSGKDLGKAKKDAGASKKSSEKVGDAIQGDKENVGAKDNESEKENETLPDAETASEPDVVPAGILEPVEERANAKVGV